MYDIGMHVGVHRQNTESTSLKRFFHSGTASNPKAHSILATP
ncbi:hypothetical protein QWZ16_22320 [Vibrio ostreicida]|uniref:Uncharacterized protein n=1 Tax=Vibrio ostreicida TaxID=526588 RepID=A0ABT8C137_9VIBR|nr:hypothetical protein [Vibrio ostreicida]MDN3612336.1 hypothetical protein [Vibrio ostreicida]